MHAVKRARPTASVSPSFFSAIANRVREAFCYSADFGSAPQPVPRRVPLCSWVGRAEPAHLHQRRETAARSHRNQRL